MIERHFDKQTGRWVTREFDRLAQVWRVLDIEQNPRPTRKGEAGKLASIGLHGPESASLAALPRANLIVPDHPAAVNADNGGNDQPGVVSDSFLSPRKLAEYFGVPLNALRKRLGAWREKNLNGWVENTERGSRDAQFVYRVGSVRPLIDKLKAASEAASKRPAKKNLS